LGLEPLDIFSWGVPDVRSDTASLNMIFHVLKFIIEG
jgi:hypothetical protein